MSEFKDGDKLPAGIERRENGICWLTDEARLCLLDILGDVRTLIENYIDEDLSAEERKFITGISFCVLSRSTSSQNTWVSSDTKRRINNKTF